MANRRPQTGSGGRRMEFNRNDRSKNFGGRSGVSPWQGGGPGTGLPNLLPLAGGSTEATLALASNIINLLQPRQNPVPSLLDMPIRRDFVPNMGRFDRNFGPNRMGNQGNFRRTGNYNRAGERINTNRKQFKPNDGPKQQNKSSPKKDADSKAKPVKESDTEDKEKPKEPESEKPDDEKKESPKTRYDDINPQLLKCHICNKSMWDGRSFENHLSGRAHAIMMQKTAESYALTADTMRQEFKIREMKRTRKSGVQPPRDFYCAMCDMYAADGAAHRTTVGHRKLKKYLHPACTACRRELPTRIELDTHRLTPAHLRNLTDKLEVLVKPKPEVMVISTLTMEQTYLRDDRQRRRRDGPDDKNEKDTDKDGEEIQEQVVKTEDQSGAEGDDKKTEKSSIDNEKTILDYKEGDDLSHVTSDMIPAYSTERGVGASFLSEFRCFQCRLCHKLLDSEETAQVHLRTWKHHQLFIRSLQPQNEGKRRGGDDDKKRDDDEQYDGDIQEAGSKRRIESDDDGQWKRRKTYTDDEHDDLENGHEDVKTEMNQTHDNDGDMEMPPADELEDWEQSIDEILDDEKKYQEQEEAEPAKTEPEQEPEPAPEPEPVSKPEAVSKPEPALNPESVVNPEPVAKPESPKVSVPEEKARSSPRRGRGRGRGRGRY